MWYVRVASVPKRQSQKRSHPVIQTNLRVGLRLGDVELRGSRGAVLVIIIRKCGTAAATRTQEANCLV